MSGLPDDVAALLTAIRDALDVPLPALTGTDQARYDALLAARASDVRILLEGLLERDVNSPAEVAERMRQWTARRPVNYAPWVPRDGRGDGS